VRLALEPLRRPVEPSEQPAHGVERIGRQQRVAGLPVAVLADLGSDAPRPARRDAEPRGDARPRRAQLGVRGGALVGSRPVFHATDGTGRLVTVRYDAALNLDDRFGTCGVSTSAAGLVALGAAPVRGDAVALLGVDRRRRVVVVHQWLSAVPAPRSSLVFVRPSASRADLDRGLVRVTPQAARPVTVDVRAGRRRASSAARPVRLTRCTPTVATVRLTGRDRRALRRRAVPLASLAVEVRPRDGTAATRREVAFRP